MNAWEIYYLASDVTDALNVLAAAPGPARVIAGGTDLLLDLQQGRHPPIHTLIDVTAIPEMNLLEARPDGLFVGAAVPLNRVVASPLVAFHTPALREAAGLIGGPQVRNTATLGGNVAHALPAGDGAISLLALDARAEVASPQGRSLRRMEDLYVGPGRSALDPRCELLVGFHQPPRTSGQGSAFRRVMRPQGVAIAILNMAAWVHRQGEQILDVRLSVGPAGPRPLRAGLVENALRGQTLNETSLMTALEALLAEARFRTSPHRATSEYRRHVARVLLEDTLRTAWERAGE